MHLWHQTHVALQPLVLCPAVLHPDTVSNDTIPLVTAPRYYDCLMKPNAKSVTTALRKVKDLPFKIVANGHGPLLRYNVPELGGWQGAGGAEGGRGGGVQTMGAVASSGRVEERCLPQARGADGRGLGAPSWPAGPRHAMPCSLILSGGQRQRWCG